MQRRGSVRKLLVKVPLSMAVSEAGGQVGDVVTQLLDGIHLLVQEVALDKVRHLRGGGGWDTIT